MSATHQRGLPVLLWAHKIQNVNYKANETIIGGRKLRTSSTALVVILVLICVQSLPVIVNGQSGGTSTISGTVRCGSGCSTVGLNYGDPIQSAGRVAAHMTVALDPYTGAQRPDLPTTDGQTSFVAADHGQYEVQGLNPGIYDLYAFATGYRDTLVASGITVHPGQSLHYDCYMATTGAVPEFFSPTLILISVFGFVALSLVAKRQRRK